MLRGSVTVVVRSEKAIKAEKNYRDNSKKLQLKDDKKQGKTVAWFNISTGFYRIC